MAAGQEGMMLHTMAIFQAYQVDILKEMDEGGGLTELLTWCWVRLSTLYVHNYGFGGC